jgi:hypothetical protein
VLLFFRINAGRKYFILTVIWIREVVFGVVELFAFLTSMVDGNNWSASHYSSVVIRERTFSTHWSARTIIDAVAKEMLLLFLARAIPPSASVMLQ